MHKYHWYRKGKAILEIEVYLKKEMYYDMQTSKFKLKSMKHRVHASFFVNNVCRKVVKSCETFWLSFSIHKMVPCQNSEFFEQI